MWRLEVLEVAFHRNLGGLARWIGPGNQRWCSLLAGLRTVAGRRRGPAGRGRFGADSPALERGRDFRGGSARSLACQLPCRLVTVSRSEAAWEFSSSLALALSSALAALASDGA